MSPDEIYKAEKRGFVYGFVMATVVVSVPLLVWSLYVIATNGERVKVGLRSVLSEYEISIVE